MPTGKVKCKRCNAKPIDIEYLAFNDTVRVKVCGKCYGRGYQSKRDTEPVIGFYLCDASEADYSNKRRMIKGLLTDIDLHRASMILNIERIEYEEKQKKLGKKSDYAEIRFDFLKAEDIPDTLRIVKKNLNRVVSCLLWQVLFLLLKHMFCISF